MVERFYMLTTPLTIEQVNKNLIADRQWRERRHAQITTNYELYRDTVIVNRLLQRQSVNVPYMKKTLKTYLTQTNWPVDNEYESKSNDKQAELFLNAYWEECAQRLRLDVLEEVDRKQEFLCGRSYMKMNILDGWFHMELVDWFDILVDRYVNPWDIQSARRITHVGIYRSLSDISRNPLYDADAVTSLKDYFNTEAGIVQAGQNSQLVADRAQRMLDLGVPDVVTPLQGETYVEINECLQKVWDETDQRDVIMVIVTGQASEILMQKPLEDILNINIFPIASWAGDVERTDVYSDGGADSVRGLNLVANARWSQKVENGMLANWGMNFYDATAQEGWVPVGYDPKPFGFYPLPGKPSDVLQSVTVPQMPDVFGEMNWIDGEIQGVSGATAIENGQNDPNDTSGEQTAQEIQILAAKAKQRAQNVSKYHKRYWQDIGEIFVALVQANGKDMHQPTLHKKSPKGKFYAKTLDLAQTYSKDGYKVTVGSKADKESDSLEMIQKLQVAQAQFPNNIPLQKIAQEKTLDWLGLTPEEQAEVMNFAAQNPIMQGPPGMPATGSTMPPAASLPMKAPMTQPTA